MDLVDGALCRSLLFAGRRRTGMFGVMQFSIDFEIVTLFERLRESVEEPSEADDEVPFCAREPVARFLLPRPGRDRDGKDDGRLGGRSQGRYLAEEAPQSDCIFVECHGHPSWEETPLTRRPPREW